MALEKTVLTEASITNILKDSYAIQAVSVEKIRLGSANCYRVSDKGRRYFLKEFQSGFPKDNLIREAELVDFLSKSGIPVACFIPTVSGEPFVSHRGHLICLEEYLDGITYGYGDFPKALLCEAARMLGKIHRALRNYPLPEDMGEAWLSACTKETLTAKYDHLLTYAESRTDGHTARIISDLQYKKDLAVRCIDYKRFYRGVTYCPTHGDYQGCQLVCGGEHIRGVTDFSSARSLPVTWEIMRSYVQSDTGCRKNAVIDPGDFCAYVQEYMKYSPLTKADLTSMPYVYLLQLARSRFGYTQYLTGDSDDREELLRFAFWRTDMCREVERKADDICRALLSI